MFGYVEWVKTGRKGVSIGERPILRLHVCCASILRQGRMPEPLLRRRCAAAARKMARLGVRCAVFPTDFSYEREFARYGIRPADPLPLYRALASELVRAEQERRGLAPGSAVIAVADDRLSLELQRTVTEVCIRNRYVTLSARGEGEALCRQLRREYGASLVLTDDPQQLIRADILVLFAPRPELQDVPNALELYAGGKCPPVELRLSDDRDELLPPECSRPQLLAVLLSAGVLRPGQVEISGKTSD